MRLGSLCSGAGALDMAAEHVFGAKAVWHCEINDAASKVLEYRYGLPNHRDLTATDWDAVEPVDILTGGYPCQPFSHAGQRKGTDDERHIWPSVREAIRRVRPRLAILENVAGHRSLGFDRVLGDLAEDGMHVRWTSLRAADVGAPHGRERLWIFVTPDPGNRIESQWTWSQGRQGRQWSPVGTLAGRGGDDALDLLPTPCAQQSGNTPENHLGKKPGRKVVTDLAILVENGLLATGGELLPTPQAFDRMEHVRSPEKIAATEGGCRNLRETVVNELLATPQARDYKGVPADGFNTANLCRDVSLLCTPSASDGEGGKTSRSGARIDEPLLGGQAREMDGGWGKYAAAIARWETVTRPAPSPTELNRNGKPRLNPAFSEWMMGWPAGWVTGVPGISRNDQLRIIGNGVVPQQAIAALEWLLSLDCAVGA